MAVFEGRETILACVYSYQVCEDNCAGFVYTVETSLSVGLQCNINYPDLVYLASIIETLSCPEISVLVHICLNVRTALSASPGMHSGFFSGGGRKRSI